MNPKTYKSRFNVGDKVWIVHRGKAIEKTVWGVGVSYGEIKYDLDDSTNSCCHVDTPESDIFSSKEEMLNNL